MKKLNDYFMKTNSGFTLVESVIAIAIVGVIGLIMADVLNRAFENGNKTALLSNIQQTGQAALNTIEGTSRYSKFVCVGDGSTGNNVINTDYSVMAISKDGRYIRYIYKAATSMTNGYISEDFPVYTGTATDICNLTTPVPGTATNQHKLTNDVALSVKSAAFTLLNKSSVGGDNGASKVTVSIKFSLVPTINANQRVGSQIGTTNGIDFSNTLQFR